MKRNLSFYVTIKDITIRLKNSPLRTISYVAEHLAEIDHSDSLDISVTTVTKHYDYVFEDAEEFVEFVKAAIEHQSSSDQEGFAIDSVIKAVRINFDRSLITRNSNTLITVDLEKDHFPKFRIFAGLLDEIVLIENQSDLNQIRTVFNSIDELIERIKVLDQN